MDTDILRDLGLTNAEVKIYLSLLELGTSTAGPIISKTGLQNSVVHGTLPKLAEKGFISYIKKGGRKEYSASDPKKILNFIDEKKKRFKKVLPMLLEKQTLTVKQNAEVYLGFNGLKTMLFELIKDAKKGDNFLFFIFSVNNPEDYEKVYRFYREDYYEERKKKGVLIKGLAPITMRKQVEKARWTKNKIRFVNFPIPTNILICNNKIAFTPWEEGQVSFLINSKQLANSFKKYFINIWKSAKK